MSHLDFSNCNSNGKESLSKHWKLFEFSWSLTVSLLIVISTGNTSHEWDYGTYEFGEQNLSSANSTTEESSTNDNEYIPGTFEGTFTDASIFMSMENDQLILLSPTIYCRTGKDP